MRSLFTNSKWFVPLSMLFIVVVCIVSRLPQLYSTHLLLDEDECVLGLMAKHMAEGKGVAVFFWGQSYGFSLVETSLISLFYYFTGITDYSVKLAMLSLFIAAIIFFYKTLLVIRPSNKLFALLITLMLVLSPTWAVWSMKARGGYLTAFFLCSVCTWLLFRENRRPVITYLVLGTLLAFIFYSQPLWLPGLAPLVFYKLLHSDRYTRLLNMFAGAFPVVFVMELLKQHLYTVWSPKVFDFNTQHISQLPSLLFDHLHGYYYLNFIYKPSLIAIVCAGLFLVLIAGLIILAVWVSIKDLESRVLFVLSVLSILFTLGYVAFLREHTPRYLLPIAGFTLLSLFIYFRNATSLNVYFGIAMPFIFAGTLAMYTFKDYSFNPYNRQQLQACVDYLQQHQLHYVFCNDVPTEWQILFYSREHIICRESNNIDRYPVYVQQVSNAYKTNKLQTAVVDFSGDLADMAPDNAVRVGEKFFIVSTPDEQLLKDMEVKF